MADGAGPSHMVVDDTPLAKSWDNAGRDIFVPEHYAMQDDTACYAFIAANPVAQVFSSCGGQMQVTAVPFLRTQRLDGDKPLLSGHLAARNPQVEAIKSGAPALLNFSTGGAYISPRWFRKNTTAPTWSYVSVQVRGRFVPFEDADRKLELLDRTVAHMEALAPVGASEKPWTMEALSAAQMERYLTMVTAFHIEIDAMEGICRLNQDKDRSDMEGIIAGLTKQDGGAAHHIARLMRENLMSADLG